MKQFIYFMLSMISCIGGLLLSLYLSFVTMLYGGIVDIFNGISPINAALIAMGTLKILFHNIPLLIALMGALIGMFFYEKAIDEK